MKAQAPRCDKRRATTITMSGTQATEIFNSYLACEYEEDPEIFQHGALSHRAEM